jgi:LacI family purine nucleotide synthesis repressor
MVTIKDVASLAGVSPTTVSIVLNGKAVERKIPPETREKIENAMVKLAYRPNLSARKLRSSEGQRPVIGFYWPIDYRINMLAWFLNEMQGEFKRKKFDCELVVQTYKNDAIAKDSDVIIKGNYNAVIVGAASELDIKYLESLSPQVPILLINRSSNKYSTVGVDNERLAQMAAQLFYDKGYRELVVVRSAQRYLASNLRTGKFIETCEGLGINIPESNIVSAENTQDGGIKAAESIASKFKTKLRAVFCDSDTIALGMVYAFNRLKIKIPEKLELLTIAMTEISNTSYYTPSISSISMPTDKIAAKAVDITIDSLTGNNPLPRHKLLEPSINIFESFSR